MAERIRCTAAVYSACGTFSGRRISGAKELRIGLRTLTVSQEKDAWGEEFAFCINGVKIFAKGADYIPEDCIYSKITPERIYELLDTAVACHFNCIRIWGGGYYPADVSMITVMNMV